MVKEAIKLAARLCYALKVQPFFVPGNLGYELSLIGYPPIQYLYNVKTITFQTHHIFFSQLHHSQME